MIVRIRAQVLARLLTLMSHLALTKIFVLAHLQGRYGFLLSLRLLGFYCDSRLFSCDA
jgi:hypothetical protein